MTATQTRIRRGTAAQIDAMTPAADEVISDTTNKRLRLGDGLKAGGIHQASAKDVQDFALNGAIASGSANNITLTLAPALTEYKDGTTVRFKAIADNTGGTDLDAGKGAVAIQKFSGSSLTPLTGGEIITGNYYTAIYNGTFWVLESGGGSIISFASAQQSYTAGSTVTMPHGLGVVPRKISLMGVSLATQGSLVTNQRFKVEAFYNGANNPIGAFCRADATNIYADVTGNGLVYNTNTLNPTNTRIIGLAEA